MSAYVKYRGDRRKLVVLAVEAAFGEKFDYEELIDQESTELWRGQRLRFFSVEVVPKGTFTLLHDASRRPFSLRAWSRIYPTALSLCEAAGVEVLEVMTWEEYLASVKKLANSFAKRLSDVTGITVRDFAGKEILKT